jgi:hypothetical protein
VVALIAILTSHPIWPPKILNTCSLGLFALIAVLGFTLGKNDDRSAAPLPARPRPTTPQFPNKPGKIAIVPIWPGLVPANPVRPLHPK